MSRLLQEVFEERSAAQRARVTQQARLAEIHRRIKRSRRRRATSAGAAVLGVVAVAATVTVGLYGVRRDPGTEDRLPGGEFVASSPAATPTPTIKINGVPEYLEGAHVRDAAPVPLPARTASLTFVPKSTKNLVIISYCSAPNMMAPLTFPDGGSTVSPCGIRFGPYSAKEWALRGIHAGKPATIVITAEGGAAPRSSNGRLVVPASGTIAVAIGEMLPFEQYRLPPKPSALPPLAAAPDDVKVIATVRSAPGDPLAPQTMKVDWRKMLNFFAQLQTPGSLRVIVDGRDLMTCEKWDFAATSPTPRQVDYNHNCGEELLLAEGRHPGGPDNKVTVKVVPRHVTGDWAVRIYR